MKLREHIGEVGHMGVGGIGWRSIFARGTGIRGGLGQAKRECLDREKWRICYGHPLGGEHQEGGRYRQIDSICLKNCSKRKSGHSESPIYKEHICKEQIFWSLFGYCFEEIAYI